MIRLWSWIVATWISWISNSLEHNAIWIDMAIKTPILPRGYSSKFYALVVKLSHYIEFTYWLDIIYVTKTLTARPKDTLELNDHMKFVLLYYQNALKIFEKLSCHQLTVSWWVSWRNKFPENTILVTTILIEQPDFWQNWD